MEALLILVIVVLGVITFRRVQVARRGQRIKPPLIGVEPIPGTGSMAGPEPESQPEERAHGSELPLSPARQVRRAVLGAQGTRVVPRHNPVDQRPPSA